MTAIASRDDADTPKPSAQSSTGILVAIFHILDRDEPFHEPGPEYFIKRHNPERRARRLINELTTLGYNVTAQAPAV